LLLSLFMVLILLRSIKKLDCESPRLAVEIHRFHATILLVCTISIDSVGLHNFYRFCEDCTVSIDSVETV
jgi:hypothetical protein